MNLSRLVPCQPDASTSFMGFDESNRWRGGRGSTKWIFTPGDVAEAVDIAPAQVRQHATKGVFDPGDVLSFARYVVGRSPAEKTRIAKLLFAAGCDPTKAAAALGITRSTLYRWAKG